MHDVVVVLQRTGMPAARQELWVGSTFLSIGKMLVFYGIGNGAVLTIQFASYSADVTIG